MSTTVKAILVLVIIAVLAGGGFAVFHKSNNSAAPSYKSTTSAPNTMTSQPASTPAASVAATITFTDNGFAPALTTVKAGDTVRISNTSSQPMQLDSDPHPTHTDEPELNVGEVDPGKSTTFILTKKGNWGFHDHLDPSLTGRIDVQ